MHTNGLDGDDQLNKNMGRQTNITEHQEKLVKTLILVIFVLGVESWTIKEADRKRIDPFKLWRLRRLVRVRWSASTNVSIIDEMSI